MSGSTWPDTPADRTYRAACAVNFVLRFDETLQVATRVAADAVSTDRLDAGVVDTSQPTDPLDIVRAQQRGRRFAQRTSEAAPVAASFALQPLVMPGDALSVVANRQPLSCTVHEAALRKAGEFEMEILYADLPVDHRTISAVGVEIHMGVISADDFARGMAGERDADGRLLSTLKTSSGLIDPYTGRQESEQSTLVFYGAVDEWENNDDRDSGARIKIKGRDLRGIFLDAKVPKAVLDKLQIDRPLDEVIANLLNTLPHPYGLVFDVVTDPDEWPDGKVPVVGDKAGLIRLRAGGDVDTTQKKADSVPTGVNNRVSYWDAVTYYCNLRGAVPFFRGSTLHLRPVTEVLSTRRDRQVPTPFEGDRARFDGADEIRVRRLVLGRSVKSISRRRKFGGVVVPRVIATSVDDRVRGKAALLEESWPPENSAAAKLKGEVEPLRVPVPGVVDRDQLRQVARATYEEVGRGEMTGSVSSGGYLASFGGDDSDPDLLWVRAADDVEIVVDAGSDRDPAVAEASRHVARSFDEEVAAVAAQLGDPVLARVLVATRRGAILDQLDIYRVDEVKKDYKARKGISVEIEFSNYIVARHEEKVADRVTSPKTNVQRKRVRVTGHQGPVTLQGQPITLDKRSFKELAKAQATRDREVTKVRHAVRSVTRDVVQRLRALGLDQATIDSVTGGQKR